MNLLTNGAGMTPAHIPRHTEVERLVLGTMILDTEVAKRGIVDLTPEDFAWIDHRTVFRAIVKALDSLESDELLDAPAVVEVLRESEIPSPALFIAELLDSTVTRESYTQARIDQLRSASFRRRMIVGLETLAFNSRNADVSTRDLLEDLETEADILLKETGVHSNPFKNGSRTAADLMSTQILPPPSLIQGVLYTGLVGLLVGKAGIGKTWVAFQLARAVAEGSSFFGLSGSPGRVGMVLLETPSWATQDRLRAIGEGGWLKDVVIRTVDDLQQANLDLCNRVTSSQLSHLVQSENLSLLVLDPLSFLHQQNENEAQGANAIMAALKQIALDTGAAVLVLHHERKGAPGGLRDSDLDAGRGSSALVASAGLYMRLSTKRKKHCLTFPKVQAGKQPEPIYLEPTKAGHFEQTEPPPDRSAAKAEKLAFIRNLLADGKPRKLDQITEEMGSLGQSVTERTVRNYLGELKKAKEIKQPGHGTYQIVQEVGSESKLFSE